MPLLRVLCLLVGIFVGVRVELARTVRTGVQGFARMRRHVFLQVDRPLEGLVAVLAIQLLCRVYVLLVLAHALLAVELLVADVAVVALVLALVPQHVLVEAVPVLHLLAADGTGDARRRRLHVVDLVREERLFGLEGLRTDLAHEWVAGTLVHRLDVHVQGALLRVTGERR